MQLTGMQFLELAVDARLKCFHWPTERDINKFRENITYEPPQSHQIKYVPYNNFKIILKLQMIFCSASYWLTSPSFLPRIPVLWNSISGFAHQSYYGLIFKC